METKLEDKMKELNVVGEREMQKEEEKVQQEETLAEEIAGACGVLVGHLALSARVK